MYKKVQIKRQPVTKAQYFFSAACKTILYPLKVGQKVSFNY